jgi:hypothetical protein
MSLRKETYIFVGVFMIVSCGHSHPDIIRALLPWTMPPGGDMQHMTIFGKGSR